MAEQKTSGPSAVDKVLENFNRGYMDFLRGIGDGGKDPRVKAHMEWVVRRLAESVYTRDVHAMYERLHMDPTGDAADKRKFGALNPRSALFGDPEKYPALAELNKENVPAGLRIADRARQWSEEDRQKFWDGLDNMTRLFRITRAGSTATPELLRAVLGNADPTQMQQTLESPLMAGQMVLDRFMSGDGDEIGSVLANLCMDTEHTMRLTEDIAAITGKQGGGKLDLSGLRRLTEGMTDEDRSKMAETFRNGEFQKQIAEMGGDKVLGSMLSGQAVDPAKLMEMARQAGADSGEEMTEEAQAQLTQVADMLKGLGDPSVLAGLQQPPKRQPKRSDKPRKERRGKDVRRV